MKTVSLFVDVQNIYYTTKQKYGCNFDYNKFWVQATQEREIVKAVAYATSRGDKKRTEFQNILPSVINPYGEGNATEKILEVLKNTNISEEPKKEFYNL